jgi:putative flippase GtrA
VGAAAAQFAVRAAAIARPAGIALRTPANWIQFVKFCLVGGSGYVVNLAVYSFCLRELELYFLAAAVCSFLVSVSSNYALNRIWTFCDGRGHVASQGFRYLVVSTGALCGNLAFLALLVSLGVEKLPAQAAAIVLVMPVSFLGNKLWTFRAY